MTENIAKKQLGSSGIKVSVMGLGCMGISEFYGAPIETSEGIRLIHHALEHGINFFDTADMYGSGHNEELLAAAFRGRRQEAVIATKFGIVREGKKYARKICGRPEYVRKACHKSLRRLGMDYIDLYYIHRVDVKTPIEDTVGEMAKLVEEGKIKAIGICEASSPTLRRAHQEHPISALQTEYSMLTRDPEAEILSVTNTLGITFVPYSPICRGLLSTTAHKQDDPADFRMHLPRFQGDSYKTNKHIARELTEIAEDSGCTLAQLSLAWVMAQGDNIIPIPGTTKIKNLDSNIEAARIKLCQRELERIGKVLDSHTVKGERYTLEGMKGVNA